MACGFGIWSSVHGSRPVPTEPTMAAAEMLLQVLSGQSGVLVFPSIASRVSWTWRLGRVQYAVPSSTLGKGLSMLLGNAVYGQQPWQNFWNLEDADHHSPPRIEWLEMGVGHDVELTLKAENCRRADHDDAPQIHQMPNDTPRMRR